jgi:hypothetical protein
MLPLIGARGSLVAASLILRLVPQGLSAVKYTIEAKQGHNCDRSFRASAWEREVVGRVIDCACERADGREPGEKARKS